MLSLLDTNLATAEKRGVPLFTIRGLCSVLGLTCDQILRKIEEGAIAWCFDLSLVPERAKKRELRVLPACIDDFVAARECKLEWKDITRLVTFEESVMTAKHIERVLNVSQAHVAALIRRKLLVPERKASSGPRGSARVATETFLTLLKSRRFF